MEGFMTRTNIIIDESLISQAKRLTGLHTMREVVHQALKELVRHRRQRDILSLRGQVGWEGDLSQLRQARHF